jgi:N-acylneuraminate cytidylyltransferase
MKNLCIIPARGGSKRIPRKNVKPFMGKPIISYSIENAKATGLFNEIMVSTDDSEIVEIAKQYGASVPFLRSEKTANDYATLADVLQEVLECYSKEGKSFDNMCCILATCPMVKSESIIDAYKMLVQSKFTTICPMVAFSYPILRSFSIDEKGEMVMNWPEYANARSQDLKPAYHDSGTFYWHKIDPWLAGNRRRGGIVISEDLVQDIDTEQDWKMAEMKYRIINNNL